MPSAGLLRDFLTLERRQKAVVVLCTTREALARLKIHLYGLDCPRKQMSWVRSSELHQAILQATQQRCRVKTAAYKPGAIMETPLLSYHPPFFNEPHCQPWALVTWQHPVSSHSTSASSSLRLWRQKFESFINTSLSTLETFGALPLNDPTVSLPCLLAENSKSSQSCKYD